MAYTSTAKKLMSGLRAANSQIKPPLPQPISRSPLYGPTVVDFINRLEAGETFDKTIVNPEEGVFDCVGGIACGSEAKPVTSILAADVIAERQY